MIIDDLCELVQFSNHYRGEVIETLQSKVFDLAVVGGGITGAGIALDAVSRGLSVALVEKGDFASGTSSKSTKLIHGGLRYLKQFEFRLVKEVGRERAIVYRNAMNLVLPEKMLLPIYQQGSIGKWTASLGLFIYDLLAGVRFEERRKMLDHSECLKSEPLLTQEGLKGGSIYYEYRTDDARLVISLLKTAVKEGAYCLNYCEALRFNYEGERVNGLHVRDGIQQTGFTINAKKVVNAGGPWVDLIRKKDNTLQGKRLQLTKGVHIVVPHSKFSIQQAIYFDSPDGRMIFAIPRDDSTYIGTTDTVYNQDINRPEIGEEDIAYLLEAITAMFPTVKLNQNDIISGWAGLRPLIHEDGKSPSELSRKDEIFFAPSGLLSIAGGKLTGYRKMAKRVVDMVMKEMTVGSKSNFKKCQTKNLQLEGSKFASPRTYKNYISEKMEACRKADIPIAFVMGWISRYGTGTDQIIEAFTQSKSLSRPVQIQALIAELDFTIENEMICNISDFLIRRTGLLYFNPQLAMKYRELLNATLAKKLNMDEDQRNQSLQDFEEAAAMVTKFDKS